MTLHILWKDTRRLWPGIVASLIVLGALAHRDRWRADWLAGSTEGYLNLLLPILWACLLALAVEQDPIPGDRQFWITRPFPRPSLLAAKLLFAVLFVHVPSLAGDSYILAARGFSPLAHAPQLLLKQLVLACALTLPAIALAAVVRSFSHFVMELVALAAIIVVVTGPFYSYPVFEWEPLRSVRLQLVTTIAACAGIAVIALQYFGRRTLFSRTLAGAATIAGALLFALLMPATALAIRTALAPVAIQPAIAFDPAPRGPFRNYGRQVTVAVPVAYNLPDGVWARPDVVRSEIETASGTRYTEMRPARYDPTRRRSHDFWLGVEAGANVPGWLVLMIDPRLFPSIARQPVTLRGEASFGLYRFGPPSTMPIGSAVAVPGVGRCMTNLVNDPFRESLVKVECESPERDPGGTRVRVVTPDGYREWTSAMGNARSVGSGPAITWLSPLHRDLTYFNVGELYARSIPRAAVATARVEITPQIPEGTAAVNYELRNIDLRKFVVNPPTPAGAR